MRRKEAGKMKAVRGITLRYVTEGTEMIRLRVPRTRHCIIFTFSSLPSSSGSKASRKSWQRDDGIDKSIISALDEKTELGGRRCEGVGSLQLPTPPSQTIRLLEELCPTSVEASSSALSCLDCLRFEVRSACKRSDKLQGKA